MEVDNSIPILVKDVLNIMQTLRDLNELDFSEEACIRRWIEWPYNDSNVFTY